MRILATGGAGFIGSHISEFHAKRGEKVIVFDNLFRAQFRANLFAYKNYINGLIRIMDSWKLTNSEATDNENPAKGSYMEELAIMKKINRDLCKLFPLFYNEGIYYMPSWIIFTISHKCNLQCPHCWTHGTKELCKLYNHIEDMDMNRILPRIEACLPAVSDYSLTMTGEPLLIKDFRKIIRCFGRYGAKLNLVTNGTLLSKENVFDVISNSSNITLSIDGARKATFEKLRKGASYEQVMENIGMLMDCISHYQGEKPNVAISFTLMGSNIDDVGELVMLASGLGINYVQLLPVQIRSDQKLIGEDISYHYPRLVKKIDSAKKLAADKRINLHVPDITRIQEKLFPYENISKFMIIPELNDASTSQKIRSSECACTPSTCRPHEGSNDIIPFDKFSQIANLYSIIVEYANRISEMLSESEKLIDLKKEHFYCESLQQRMYIDNKGSVSPCCIDGRPELGNMFDEPINEIWKNDNYLNFRKKFYSDSPPPCCSNCIFRQKMKAENILFSTEYIKVPL